MIFSEIEKQFLIAKHLPAEQNQKDTTSNNINNNNKSESVKEN